jgi:hypothetical protein
VRHPISFFLKSSFFIGLFLLSANILGLFTSLRNQDIFSEENTDIILDEEQVYEALNGDLVDRKSYTRTVNELINKGVAHYWHDDGISKYNLRLPFHENYLLFFASYIRPEIFLKYEFMDYRRAIERGVGLCSQQAIIVADVLQEKRIHSKMIRLSGTLLPPLKWMTKIMNGG